MAAAIAFEFLHPVLLTVAGFAALGFSWVVPADLHRRRWWPVLALAVGSVVAVVAALCGLVPWFGQIHLAAYALFLVAGFIVSFVVIRPRALAIGISQQTLIDCFLIAVVLGVVGARARYVYERWDTFLHEAHGDVHRALVAAADLDVGGAVGYGGLLLATVGVWLYARYRRVRTLAFADAIMPGLIAGLAVGRFGCYFNGCCYGAPTSMPWGVTCAHYPGQMVHPTQIYEALACAILASALIWFWARRRSDGQVTFFAMAGYGAWRFVNESLRGDHDAFAFGGAVTTSQATSLELILAALVGAAVIRWYRRTHPQAAELAAMVPGSRHAHVGVPVGNELSPSTPPSKPPSKPA